MAQLQTGDYQITSLQDHHLVGCYGVAEGQDEGEGQQIMALLPGEYHPKWHVERVVGVDKGYLLKPANTSGGVRVSHDESITTIPSGSEGSDQDPEFWVVTPQPKEGKDVYTIETRNRKSAWIVIPDREQGPNHRGSPIVIKPLERMTKEYGRRQLFNFVRLAKE